MDINTEHIIAYLEKRLPENDLKEFEYQLENSDDFRKEVEDIAFVWRTSEELKLHGKIDTDANWNQISRRIKKDKYKTKLLRYSRSAAAILILPVLFLTTFLYIELDNKNNQPKQQLHVTSAYGTVTKTVLSDGTEVWLNSGSTLSYPQTFTKGERNVMLTGEAYFKVSSDKSNRFNVIISDELIVSAYGTEFNINSYKEDNTIDVTLIEGNIQVSKTDKTSSKDIIPGQHITYNKNSKLMAMADVNLSVKTVWKDGKMIFRRANMTEVVQRLSRHFNVDIRLEGKELYDYEYSATFTTETLNEILLLLEKTAPIKYSIIEPEQSGDYSFTKRIVKISLKK
ncbi:MAG: FecR family protein [Dysgonomonas sp.]